jgi:hypothetical protein
VAEVLRSELQEARHRRSAADAQMLLDALAADGSITVVDDPEQEEWDPDEEGALPPNPATRPTAIHVRTEGGIPIGIGDHIRQEILVRGGDQEAIARREGQHQQASLTYPAEEQDAEDRAEGVEAADWADLVAEQRGERGGKTATQQVMDEHKKATEESDEEDDLPRTHDELDAIAKKERVDYGDATTVADKQAAIRKARGS